jgi:hypothetical protein
MNARNVAPKSIEAKRRRTLERSIHRIAAKVFEDGFNLMTVTAAALNPQGTMAHAARTYFSALADVIRDHEDISPWPRRARGS